MNLSLRSFSALAVALTACVLLTPMLGEDQLGLRNMGNRLEGVQARLEKAASYEVRGFVAATAADGAFSQNSSLRISYFTPDNHPLYIDAQEINDGNHYHMKLVNLSPAPGSWAEFSGWPVKDFLLPLRITRARLTVVIRRDTPDIDATELAPAILFQDQRPAVIDRYSLYWKTEHSLKSLTYELVGPQGFHNIVEYENVDGSKTVDPVDTHLITIDASKFREGWSLIRLSGRYPNSFNELHAEYRFYHKPEVR